MLLRTRFYIPTLRENSVFRRSLVEKLNCTGSGELVLISAPAGYGKTTLVSQWLHLYPHTFAWLALDQTLLTPLLFWENMINALQSIQPSIGADALDRVKTFDVQDLEEIVVSLLNDLEHLTILNNPKHPITLVLDDFHLVDNPILLQSFNLFLDHLPPGIRVVLTARKEPELSLARRRANNQLIELQAENLEFDLDETHEFLQQTMALHLLDSEVDDLRRKTEGWVVGLQLAALSIQRGGDKKQATLHQMTVNRDIADYLFEEVFTQQPEELQHFLTLTSCPERFCAALGNAITGRQDSPILFKQLDRLNLFLVPLDDHRTWYRYHDLFRHFLLARFREMLPAEQYRVCHKAAAWLEESGYINEAIDLLLEFQDWVGAQELLEHFASDVGEEAPLNRLQYWIERLPPINRSQISFIDQIKALSEERHHNSIVKKQSTVQIEPLTKREAEVMFWVKQGFNNKQIAEKLCISPNTLKVHIRNLYGKMGVENRTQAVLKATDNS